MSLHEYVQRQSPADRERNHAMYREWVRRKAAAPPERKDAVLLEVLHEFYPEEATA